jgi:uncharacterized protein YdeI (YjbR/CyaY-like superfamily)
MAKKDKRVDEYISTAGDFAKPILIHLRNLIHETCPGTEEKIKWGFPHFDYKGMMCSMAAFKNHCAFNFWKFSLMKDSKELSEKNESAMGHLGKITDIKDLPTDKRMIGWIKEAMALNDNKVKLPERKKKPSNMEIEIPIDLQNALNKNKIAAEIFNNFSNSHKKEYTEWINEAKSGETRNRRIVTTIEWAAEGKSRNWKYIRK